MNRISDIAPAFVEVAHRVVWCTVATVDGEGRPRSRILHPYWEWTGTELVGWIGTEPTAVKREHLSASPYVSCNYWDATHDVATAECLATWCFDDETRQRVWDLFRHAPEPVGYDPAMVPRWAAGPRSSAFAALRLDPWRLRVFPGSVLLGRGGEVMVWSGQPARASGPDSTTTLPST